MFQSIAFDTSLIGSAKSDYYSRITSKSKRPYYCKKSTRIDDIIRSYHWRKIKVVPFTTNSIKSKYVSNYRMLFLFRSIATRPDKAGNKFNASSCHRRLAEKTFGGGAARPEHRSRLDYKYTRKHLI